MNIVEVNYNWEKPWANISTDELKNEPGESKGAEERQEGRKCYFLCFDTRDFSSSGNVEERWLVESSLRVIGFFFFFPSSFHQLA